MQKNVLLLIGFKSSKDIVHINDKRGGNFSSSSM